MADIRDIFENFFDGYSRENLYTSMPAIVLAVHSYATRQTVDVRPAISRLKTTGQVISNDELVIYEVPIVSPAGGGGLLSFPIKAGDNVWLNFSMRSLEDWQHSDGSGEIAPSDSRHFHQTDAIAFPCIYTSLNNLKPSADNVELKFGDCKLSMKPSGEVVVNNGGAVVTLKANGDIDIDPATLLRVLGNSTIIGNVEIQGTLHVTGNTTVDTQVSTPTVAATAVTTSTMAASVSASVAGKDFGTHTHNLVGVQTGASTIPSGVPN